MLHFSGTHKIPLNSTTRFSPYNPSASCVGVSSNSTKVLLYDTASTMLALSPPPKRRNLALENLYCRPTYHSSTLLFSSTRYGKGLLFRCMPRGRLPFPIIRHLIVVILHKCRLRVSFHYSSSHCYNYDKIVDFMCPSTNVGRAGDFQRMSVIVVFMFVSFAQEGIGELITALGATGVAF